ncbi:hypothetical protein [Nonomuraea sp. LPB2021202275-12-8]|uniref:hypothetical protein n=1 Tax=Nonomuraea sp. LPB2021202275-12-8 TaxID=3120159 RepID=UPI00300C83A0
MTPRPGPLAAVRDFGPVAMTGTVAAFYLLYTTVDHAVTGDGAVAAPAIFTGLAALFTLTHLMAADERAPDTRVRDV